MARFSGRSILRELSTTDCPQIRRVMEALAERIQGAQARAAAEHGRLAVGEGVVVERIFVLTQGNPTLLDMAERFASARRTSNDTVLQAAIDFDTRATYIVQSQAPPGSWALAQKEWDDDVRRGLPVYDAFGMNYMPDESDKEDEMEQFADELPEAHHGRGALLQQTGRPETEEERNWPGPKFKRLSRDSKHMPLRPRNCRVINDGTHDRTYAMLNERDDTKLSMSFRLEKNEPKGSNNWIPFGRTTYKYVEVVDWSNRKHIKELNNWRNGNLNRQLGPMNPTRLPWLASERTILLDILESELPEVGGAWRNIDWADIGRQYNQRMSGVVQQRGEMTALRKYVREGVTSVSVPKAIKKTRTAPLRESRALLNQVQVWADPRSLKLVADARAVGDSSDMDEDQPFDQDDSDNDNLSDAPSN